MACPHMPVDGLVSTIIPVHNRPHLLREAVTSVIAQTYHQIEIVIVDDGLTDETYQVATALAAAQPDIVRRVRIDNSGPGQAREAGRRIARGEFIQYLDSDDLLLPDKFALQVGALRASPECGVAYGKTRFHAFGETPTDTAWKRTGEAIASMFPLFLCERWWDTSTPLYRRAVTDRAGPWLTLRSEEDWEYDCRIASQGIRLAWCPAFVSDTRTHSGEMLSWPTPQRRQHSLADRAIAQALIFQHACVAGISSELREMHDFVRSLFLLSRQCGAAGLGDEAARLFELALQASTPEHARAFDFRAYAMLARIAGWRGAGRVSEAVDRMRGMMRRTDRHVP